MSWFSFEICRILICEICNDIDLGAVALEGYLLVVESEKLFCSMLDGCRFGLEDSTVVFHFEGMLCDAMVSLRVSDITNPPPVQCSVLDPSVKQKMPWVLASMMSEFSLFLQSSVSEAVG